MENSELYDKSVDEVLSQSVTSTVSVEEEREEEELQEESPLDESQSSFRAIGVNNQDEDIFIDESPRNPSKIVFNIIDAQYPVVKQVGRKVFKWKLSSDPNREWDICWTDKSVPIETLAKMQPFQKINHFPGIQSIARKNNLGRNLMKMYRMYPKAYNFFPITYLLPLDLHEFKSQFSKKKNKTFIIKPEASSQGKGIFLTRTWESINKNEKFVAQKYIKSPYLIDGLKFDLRIYVLLAGCDPLKVYLYEDGLGRFATEPYSQPTNENLASTCMHLTNYAINKENPNFVFNDSEQADDVGHKKSLKAVFKILEAEGHDTKALWEEIKKIIVKVFCSVQPLLAHYYRSCHANEPYNNMCFEVLGFDIMLDKKLKPWLIEVNHLPSFTTDTPLDKNIKKNVIKDALQIMNISAQDKIDYKAKKKEDFNQKALSRKAKFNAEERKAAVEKAQKERDEWESKNHGGYEKIFPLDDDEENEEYFEFMKAAGQHWQTWIGADVKKDSSKNQPKQDSNQENQAAEAEPQASKKAQMSPQRKKQAVSPKHSSYTNTKRPSSSKGFYGTNNDSNSLSKASNRTAASSNNKEDFDGKDSHLSPWGQGKANEGKEQIDIIEERHNEDEEHHLSNYRKVVHLTKSASVFSRQEEQSEDPSLAGSSLTHRDIASTNLISDGNSGNHSERIPKVQKVINKLKIPNTYVLSPKKAPVKVESHSNVKDQKVNSSSKKVARAVSPSENSAKIPQKRIVNPNRKSACGMPTSELKYTKSASGIKRATSKDFENEEIAESLTPLKKPYRRVLSPQRDASNQPEKNLDRARSPERSKASPTRALRKKTNDEKDQLGRAVSKDTSKIGKETSHKAPSQEIKKKKQSKKINEEENENQPKKIVLYLSKETLTRAPVNLDQEQRKVWPVSTSSSKPDDHKLSIRNQQSSANAPLPQYYKVKLGRDASPVKMYEMKPNYTQKNKLKGDLSLKKDFTLESEVSHSKVSSLIKDLSVESTPKDPHLSPKVRRVQCNNFFK